jgi:uncharacterized membrane protein (UPF0136 family)
MLKLENSAKAMKILALVGMNLVVLLLSAALVVQEPRRWPILLAVGPALVLLTFFGLRRILGNPPGRALALPIIYGCGLLGGIYWMLYEFAQTLGMDRVRWRCD